MVHTMIMYLITDEFNIDEYLKEGLIEDYFFLHEYNERDVLWKLWKKNWGKVIMHPLKTKVDLDALRPLNQIANYHNVRQGFYFAFQAN